MDVEKEIWRLAGEVMATQSILTGLCLGLEAAGGQGRALIENAFSYAETVAQVGSLNLGAQGSQEHFTAFLGTIEQLRVVALSSHGETKRGT